VRTALGDYQRLATGGDETDDGEELGSVYTPEGDSLTGQINPDFNGYVPSSEEPDEGYLFTNWEHRPGAMTRVHLQQNGRNGTWRVLGMENLDFSAVEGTWVNCFGTVSPWGTPLTSEENYSIPDTPVWNNPDWQYKGGVERFARHLGHERNDDGIFADKFPNPYRYGYIVELKEPESEEPIPEKRFALVARRTRTRSSCRTRRPPTPPPTGPPVASTNLSPTRRVTFPQERYTLRRPLKRDRSAAIPTRSASASSGSNSGTPATRKSRSGLPSTTTSPRRTTRTVRTRISPKGRWTSGPGGTQTTTASPSSSVDRPQCGKAQRRNSARWGINIRRGAEAGEDYMYVAMSNTNRTMGDDEGDIQLNGDEWGAVYRMPLESDYDISEMEPIVTGGPEANICGGCPYDANPNANDKACQSCAFNPTKGRRRPRSFKGHDESGKIDGHEWANLTRRGEHDCRT